MTPGEAVSGLEELDGRVKKKIKATGGEKGSRELSREVVGDFSSWKTVNSRKCKSDRRVQVGTAEWSGEGDGESDRDPPNSGNLKKTVKSIETDRDRHCAAAKKN